MNLDRRAMRAVETAPEGVVNHEARFEFAQPIAETDD
jgi:hypothetical protein